MCSICVLNTSVPDLVSIPDIISPEPVPSSHSRSISSDSSSSSDYIPYPSPFHIMSSVATVENHNPKAAPTLTAGKVTPEALHQWERACKEYFRLKKVEADKQVESILSRLLDFRIADWAEANEAALIALTFPKFMEKLRGEALEKDWDRKIKLSMLTSRQGDRPFHEWAYEMQTRNALLRGRPHHFDDESLRENLENNMDQGLELRTR